MKKIFGLFAMAAVVATSLTCCGGGGGDGISGKTYIFSAPPLQCSGSMELTVQDSITTGENKLYNATVSFGNQTYYGTVKQEAPAEGANVRLVLSVLGGQEFGAGQDVWEFFSYFLPDDLEEGDTVTGLPAPVIDMVYSDGNTQGTYFLSYYLPPADDEELPEGGEGNGNNNNNDEEDEEGNKKVDYSDLELELVTIPVAGDWWVSNR